MCFHCSIFYSSKIKETTQLCNCLNDNPSIQGNSRKPLKWSYRSIFIDVNLNISKIFIGDVIDWTVSSQNSYVEGFIPYVTVFADKAFTEVIKIK